MKEVTVCSFRDFLLTEGIVDTEVLDNYQSEALKKGVTLFKLVVEKEAVHQNVENFLIKTSKCLGCKYFSLKDDLRTKMEIPENVSKSLFICTEVVPLKQSHKGGNGKRVLDVAVKDPFNIQIRDLMAQSLPEFKINWHIAHPTVVDYAVKYLKSLRPDMGQKDIIPVDFTSGKAATLQLHIESASVPEMINWFLFRAHEIRASDIHIEPGESILIIRLRVDGVLIEEASMPMELHPELTSRIKILSEMNLAEKRLPQDGRFEVRVREDNIDLRVSTFPTVYGEKVVMRLLNKDALQPSLESIGFGGVDLVRFKRALKNPFGMIIISGPTGSGKTTTLYSALNTLPLADVNVVTVEDPVEYRLTGVHQLQVKEKIGLTFASALRTILRQDPDVILVGETRDSETAAISVRAALTGHVVLTTLHTNDSVGVVTRLLDMGIEPYLLASALSMAMSQRLVRMVCWDCQETISGVEVLERLFAGGVTEERLKELNINVNTESFYEWGRGTDCKKCRNTGYFGRHAVLELFEVDARMKKVIAEIPFNEAKLRQLAKEQGMKTLMEHGIQLIEERTTTFEELIRVLGEHQ
ncbi:MAG: Flp pilus assembly complex ATPase component TadA [Nitrospirae bacterium]|nr:Flp pilus assembly complex ATPase component TadA [Nitrospirota bacterium]